MSTQKRCYYEVLNLPKTCTPDEIRSSYKKLALQRHPDKLIQSGVATHDAAAEFQELVHAYEVLSDPKERSWYDSHRSQILFSSSNDNSPDSESPFPDLFSYFSPSCYTDYGNGKTGFYKVYGDVFHRVYSNEVNYCRKMGLNLGLVKEAPLMGELGSDYNQVTAFYGYWMWFCTVMDFGWVSKWDAAGGVNRKSRRVMEEENKKLRKKAKREYNETIRGLAEFVKKRDKRVIDMMVRKEKEREQKREEEMVKRKEREREKLERARMYEEPEGAKVDETEEFEGFQEEEEEVEEGKKEFYCVVCGKKFKSDKQWKNHEKSKKHKEKVAELRKSFVEEEKFEDVEENDDEGEAEVEGKAQKEMADEFRNDLFLSEKDYVEELEEKFRDCVELEPEAGTSGKDESNSNSAVDIGNNAEEDIGNDKSDESGDESSILEAMISGRRNKKHKYVKTQMSVSEEEMETMEYNNKKGKRKSRRAKKDKGQKFEAGVSKASDCDTNVPSGEQNGLGGADVANDCDDCGQAYYDSHSNTNTGKQTVQKKGTSKKDAETKIKNSSKGRKQKEKSKKFEPVCEKCGEEFDSRNQLHKHLNDTGHSSLKYK